MKTLLNVIWLVLAGIWLALLYALAGVIMCVTIIGIPFGVAAFRMTSMVAGVVKKEAVAEVLDHVCTIRSIYRDAWSADAIEARVSAAGAVKPKLPPSGWLTRALAHDEPFFDAAMPTVDIDG